MVKLLLQAGADATLLPKPDEPPKPVVIQGFATLLPKPDEPPKPIDEPPKPVVIQKSKESPEGCASFTTREFQVDLPAHDNKTAFLVGLPHAAVGGREFLERWNQCVNWSSIGSPSPHTRFMFEVNGLQIP